MCYDLLTVVYDVVAVEFHELYACCNFVHYIDTLLSLDSFDSYVDF